MYMVIMVADQIPVHKRETFGHFATVILTMLKIRLSGTYTTYEHTNIHTFVHTDRRKDGQAGRQTGRQTNKQTNKQTDILTLHHIT